MTKRKSVTLLLLIIVMIGLIGSYLGVNQWKEKKEAKETMESSPVSISSIARDKVVKITFSNQFSTMTLVKKGESWKNEKDSEFPINQTFVASMLSAMAEIKATRTVVEKSEKLSQYGLSRPILIAEVTLDDNWTQKITIGSEVPVTGGYYAMIGEDPAIYAVDSSIYESFKYSESQMIQMEEAPSITTANITHLTISNGENGTNFEFVANDQSSWDILQPYKKPVSCDSAKISTLLSNYGSFTYNECVDYKCENPSQYGISKDGKSIIIAYFEETEKEKSNEKAEENDTTKIGKTYALFIGNVNENGDYYVQPEGSKAVYLMSGSAIETMLNLQGFDYVTQSIFAEELENIKEIDYILDGILHTIKVVNDETYTLDDKSIKEEEFLAVYSELKKAVLSREGEETVTEEEPYLSITIHSKTSSRTVHFLPDNENNFYRVSTDGVDHFLIEKNQVKSIVKVLEALE